MPALVPQDDVQALLDDNWTPGNVTKPALKVVNHNDTVLRHDMLNSGDLLTIRADTPAMRETPRGNYTYGDRVYNVILEVWTINNEDGRERAYAIMEEARRILHNKKHSMTNFQRITYMGYDELGIEEDEQVWGVQIPAELENRAVLLET